MLFVSELRLDLRVYRRTGGTPASAVRVQQDIQIIGHADGHQGGRWGQINTTNSWLPKTGNWINEGWAFNAFSLSDENHDHVLLLKNIKPAPPVGKSGPKDVLVGNPDTGVSTGLSGEGSWEVLRPPRMVSGVVRDDYTFVDWWSRAERLGWRIYTSASGGFSAGGAGLAGGYQSTNFYIRPVEDKDERRARTFIFRGAGAGLMWPGWGAAASKKQWPTFGSELEKGMALMSNPWKLEDLEGGAQVIELSAGGVGNVPGANIGAGGSYLIVSFGVPYGIDLTQFKARATIKGPSFLAGKSGFSAGAILYSGSMHLQPKG